jgi:hypothetical protein
MTFYDHIELTPKEVEAALLEARKRKYFHEKNKSYWEEQEQNAVLRAEEEKIERRAKRKSLEKTINL